MIEGLNAQVFAAYGEEGILVPAKRSVEIMRQIREEEIKEFTILSLPGAVYDFRILGDSWPPGYWERLFGRPDEHLG